MALRCLSVLTFVCVIMSIFAGDLGLKFFMWRTCEHTYGRQLYSLSSVSSLLQCVLHCDQNDECLSVMYRPSTSVCRLNNDTVTPGTFPGDCGAKYMDNIPLLKYGEPCISNTTTTCNFTAGACFGGTCGCESEKVYDPVLNSCKVPLWGAFGDPCTANITSECNFTGAACYGGACGCNTGFEYDPVNNVCAPVCNETYHCFVGTVDGLPWANDTDNLRIAYDCNTTFPNGTLLAGQLGISVVSNVPAVIEPFNFGSRTDVSAYQSIFTTLYDQSSPFLFEFQVVYYGHILSYNNNSVPICDVVPPEIDCTLEFY